MSVCIVYVYIYKNVYIYIYISVYMYISIHIYIYVYIYICIYILFKALRAVRRVMLLDFCIICDTLLRPWCVFWSHFCYFIIIFGAIWQHFLHQELDWGAKAATGGAKGQNANMKPPFWTPFLTHFDTFSRQTPLFLCFFEAMF